MLIGVMQGLLRGSKSIWVLQPWNGVAKFFQYIFVCPVLWVGALENVQCKFQERISIWGSARRAQASNTV